MSRATDRRAEPEGRDSRAWESRYSEDRLQNIRKAIHMQYGDPFFIPPEKIPADVHYYWVRVHIFKDGSEPDFNRSAEMYEKGWDFVPVTRHPEFTAMDLTKPTGKLEGCITRRGHVLVERPKVLGEMEMKVFQQEISRSIKAVPYDDVIGASPMGAMRKDEWDTKLKTGTFMD